MSGRKDIREKAKALWIRGMKAVGNTAASIANNTRYKVDEVTIQNRRREVLNDVAHKAYALWLKGESFPEPVEKLLDELKQLDEQLNDMRAEKYAMTQKPGSSEEAPQEEEPAEEEPEEDDLDPSLKDSPISEEINGLFDGESTVGKSAEKVNSTMEQLSDRIRNFPRESTETENDE